MLRGLELEQLRRFPPPKPGRVPFGHELRVLGRYLSGGNALFDPSGLWRAYRALASPRQRLLYRAFLSSEALPPGAWRELLGADELDAWQERRLLRTAGDHFRCRFRCCPIGRVLLLGDPDEPKLLRRVLIGQDSYNMVHFMDRQRLGRCARYLDVGPGSGVVLLNYAARADEAVGIDINPRAVAISRLNAELNGIANCRVVEDDALAHGQAFGRFDLVSWNTPFVFLPEECRDTHLDAFGGHLGLDLPLRFVRCLPGLLSEAGTCYLGMSAPILRSGENLLEQQLDELAAELGLDIVNHVIQTYWHAIYRDFHEAHGIDKNELVFLAIRRGSGRVRRVDPPLTTRASDRVREVAYRALR